MLGNDALKRENETRFENDASKNLKTKELMLENVVSKTNKACIQNLKTKHPRPQDKTTINCGKRNKCNAPE